MPMSSIKWDKNVAWLDIGAASAAFQAECGPDVHLISVEVVRCENREVGAYYSIHRHKPPVFATLTAVCGGPSATKSTFGHMGRIARRSAREWLGG